MCIKLLILAAIAILSGCSKQAVQKVPDKAPELGKKFINKLYNEQISQNLSNNICLLPDNTIFVYSHGVWHAPDSKKKGGEIVPVCRKYDAVKLNFSITGYSIKNIAGIDTRGYSHSATLQIQYKQRAEFLENIPGITFHAILPFNWQKLEEAKQREYIANLVTKLPDPSCDYQYLLHTNGVVQESFHTDNIAIYFSKYYSRWEFESSTTGSDSIDAVLPAWDYDNSVNIDEILKKQGFSKYKDYYLNQQDIEIAEHLRKGDIFYNNQWLSKTDWEFAKILDEHRKQKELDLKNIVTLLRQLNTYINTQFQAETATLIQEQVSNLLNKNCRNKQFLSVLQQEITSNPDWQIIVTTDIAQAIEKNLKDIEQQEIVAEKARQENEKQIQLLQQAEAKAEYLQQLKKLKYLTQQLSANPDHANLTDIYKALEQLQTSRLRETGYALLALFAHQRNNSTLFTNSITQGGKNVEQYISSIHRKCRYCKDGMKKCISCQTTGICGRCNGEGHYDSIVSENMHFVTKRFSCIKICYYCTACKSCGGTGSISLQPSNSGLRSPDPEPESLGFENRDKANACSSCNGTGQVPIQARKCTNCNGTGKVRMTSQQIKYHIRNKLSEFSNILHQATMAL